MEIPSTELTEIFNSRFRWKRRAKLFREAYRDKDCEAFALWLQKVKIGSEVAELYLLLAKAQEQVCSMLCPSTWKTGERPPHGELCQQITAALKSKKEGE